MTTNQIKKPNPRAVNGAPTAGAYSTEPLFKNKNPIEPTLYFSAKAWEQMWTLIPLAKAQNTEVTWYGPIERTEYTDGSFSLMIPEIFVPKQVVSGAACEDCEYGVVLNEAFEKGYDPSTFKMWCHLHPSASVNPSGTDIEQTQELMDKWDYMLRGIFSACGNYKMDFFDEKTETVYKNLTIHVEHPEEFELDKIRKDFKDRVKKKTYGNKVVTYGGNKSTTNRVSQGGTQKKNNQDDDSFGNQGNFWPEIDWRDQDLDTPIPFNDDAPSFDQDLIYVGTVSNNSAYVSDVDMGMSGETTDLLHVDGVSMGITLIGGHKSGDLDMSEILACMRESETIDVNTLQEMFPDVCDIVGKLEGIEGELE